jgi:hypothetical protein
VLCCTLHYSAQQSYTCTAIQRACRDEKVNSICCPLVYNCGKADYQSPDTKHPRVGTIEAQPTHLSA